MRIPCPQCGRELKLRDPSLLGKIGKCPKCGHRFPLREPDEVEMELVDSAVGIPHEAAQPSVGTSPRWVPDEQLESQPAKGRRPAANAATAAGGRSQAAADDPFLNLQVPAGSGLAELNYLKRRRARRMRVAVAVSLMTAIGAAVTMWWLMRIPEEDLPTPPQIDRAYQAEKRNLQDHLTIIDEASPTSGDPIELLYLPAGAHLIVNLHPAALWEKGSIREETRFGLGEALNSWAEESIRELCMFEPAEIQQVLFATFLGAPGSGPVETAAVVRLVEEQKKSDLLLRFRAVRDDSFTRPVYRSDQRAFIIIDGRTFVVGPWEAASEMIDAMRFPNPTDPDIEEIVRYTDQDRLLTVVFKPLDLRTFQDVLVSEDLKKPLNLLVDWLIEDVSAAAWSFHLDRDTFHSELLLRTTRETSPRLLHEKLREKLDRLPGETLAMVQKMEPQTVGQRMIIGRFPAMVYAVCRSTLGGISTDGRYVKLATRLPERAAPNLSTGLFLTWLESLRTDFTKEAPQTTEPKLPERLADRLKQTIEIDFRRTPLYGAFDYIGEETKVSFDIDGDALKAKGMTQNMAQNHKLGMVPATTAIQAIIDQYKDEGMCVVVDEQAKLATVTTLTAVEEQGITSSPTVLIIAPSQE